MLLILLILIILMMGGGGYYGYRSQWGPAPYGGLFLVIMIILALYVLTGGRLR